MYVTISVQSLAWRKLIHRRCIFEQYSFYSELFAEREVAPVQVRPTDPPLPRGVLRYPEGIGHDLGAANPVFQRMCHDRGITDLNSKEAGQFWIDNVWFVISFPLRDASPPLRSRRESDWHPVLVT